MNLFTAFIFRDLRIERKYGFHLVVKFLDFIFQMAIFYFIAGYISKPEYFNFVVVGLVFSRFFQFWLNTFSQNIRQEQYWGTGELIFLSPSRPLTVIFSSVGLKFIILIIEMVLYFAAAVWVFGAKLNFDMLFLVFFVLGSVAFSGLGLISASFVMYFKKGDPVNWLFTASIDILSGVYFPIAVMPKLLRYFSYIVPSTSALEAWRILISDGGSLTAGMILIQLIWAVSLMSIGIFVFNFAFYRVRRKGELGSY